MRHANAGNISSRYILILVRTVLRTELGAPPRNLTVGSASAAMGCNREQIRMREFVRLSFFFLRRSFFALCSRPARWGVSAHGDRAPWLQHTNEVDVREISDR